MRTSQLAGLALLIAAPLAACDRDEAPGAVGLTEWDRLELIAETSEPLIETLAREGERVVAGAVILRQDDRRLRAQRDEAAAALTQARGRLAELARGPRGEQIDRARANLQSAQSEEDNDRREWQRLQGLAEKNLVSREAADAARTRLERAAADSRALQAALAELLHGSSAEELAQAEAGVAQAEARLRALDISLDNLTLRAPRAGLVDSLPYRVGERPAAGAVVAVLLDGAAPYARVYVPEPLRVHVNRGSEVTVRVDGLGAALSGRVRTISSDAAFTPYYSLTERDRSRLAYVAEIELAGPGAERLASGIPVAVEFDRAAN